MVNGAICEEGRRSRRSVDAMKPQGPVIAFFGYCTPKSLEECKAWVRGKGWTSDDVRIKKTEAEDGYLVLAKRKLW